MSEILTVLVAAVLAASVAVVVLWADRWRIANDWRYTMVPWRRRRRTA